MRIYIDDNIADPRLATYLTKVGHEVVIPIDAGLSGVSDARHLIYAIKNSYTSLTYDTTDFEELHDLVLGCGGNHSGILLVYSVNDPTRDLTPRGIATALSKLEASGISIANEIHALNQWR